MKQHLLRGLLAILARLPLPLLRLLGRGVGGLLYWLPNDARRTARINLALCFPELEEGARRALLRRSLRHTALTLMEMPAVWRGPSEAWLARMSLEPASERIRRLLDQGRGLIVAMPHLGNFELSAHFFGHLAPATGLYRPPRQAGLEALMVEGRARPGHNRMVPTSRQGVKALYQALGRGEIIVILPDQQPKPGRGGAGVFAPFFGVPAYTMTLVNRFARRSGAPVCYIAFLRRPDGGYEVVVEEADPEVAHADAEVAVAALNAGIEALVRRAPDQYQWTYRRFRLQPDGRNPYAG